MKWQLCTLAIGNVPFGQYQVNDKAYNKLNFSIHNYFFAKALDQVRPGGVVAFAVKDTADNYKLDYATDADYEAYLKLCEESSNYKVVDTDIGGGIEA